MNLVIKKTLRTILTNLLFYTPCGGKARLVSRWLQFVKPQAGEFILDICCGNGKITALMANAVTPAGKAIGVDTDRQTATGAAIGNDHTPAFFVLADGRNLPFTDACCDKITISLGLHHMPPEGRSDTLREIYRLLKPNGSLLVMEYNLPETVLPGFLTRCLARLDSSREAYRMLINSDCLIELQKAGFRINRRDFVGGGSLQFIRAGS
jgi:ubiquinone/menaquinone biosynthesis C-methylase UbiE